MNTMVLVWATVTIVSILVELATLGLASIWFAIGGLCALLAAVLYAPLWLQILWFILISALTLLLTRPLALKYVNNRTEPTNADRVIGSRAVVRETIDNLRSSGTVLADGKIWTARSAGGQIINPGVTVLVEKIDGVKLIVTADTADS